MAANLYDAALESLDEDEQQQQQKQPPPNPYLETLDAGTDARTRAMRTATAQAHDTTPERAAQVRQLSSKTGLAPDVVERNFDDLSKRVKVESTPYAQMQRETPALAEWASDPSNAAIAKDDLEKLGLLEWIVTAPQRAFAQSVHQMRAASLRTKQLLYGDLSHEEQILLEVEKYHQDLGGRLGAGGAWYRPAVTGSAQFLANLIYGFKASAPEIAIGAGTGAVIGGIGGSFAGGVGAGPGAAAGAKFGAEVGGLIGGARFTFDLEAGGAYDEYLGFKDENGQPLDRDVARAAAIATGAINAGLEVGGIEIALHTLPGLKQLGSLGVRSAVKQALRNPTIRAALADVVKGYGKTLTAETLTEVAQRATTILAGELGKVASGQNIPLRTPSDVLDDLIREGKGALESFALGLAVTPAMSLVHDAVRVRRAQQGEAFFKALGDGVTQSKTVQRMPEAAQAFLEKATADGPLKNLYVDVAPFAEYWQSQNLDPKEVATELTGDAQAYDNATRTGEPLAVPTARYAVKLAGTPHHTFFAQELRLGPDDMNAREANALEASIVEQAKAQAEAPPAELTPAQRVRQDVVEQLVAGGVPRETAETKALLYEAMFGTTADVLGEDPLARYQRYGLAVKRPDLDLATQQNVAPMYPTPPAEGAAAGGPGVAPPPPPGGATAASRVTPATLLPRGLLELANREGMDISPDLLGPQEGAQEAQRTTLNPDEPIDRTDVVASTSRLLAENRNVEEEGSEVLRRMRSPEAGKKAEAWLAEHEPETLAAAQEGKALERGGQLGAGTQGIPQVYTQVNARDIQLDPGTYQFKASDAQGETGRLRDVKTWDALQGQTTPVLLHQRKDGTLYVADGHQRVNLAKRLEAEGVAVPPLNAIVLREADGWTPAEVRRVAALINVRQDSASPIDIAKLLRERELSPEEAQSIPRSNVFGERFRQAQDLAKLGDAAFQAVVNGEVEPVFARFVGQYLADPAEQVAAIRALAKADLPNAFQTEQFIRALRSDEFSKAVETDLFGEQVIAESLAAEKAQILDAVRRQLHSQRSAFGNALRNEAKLREAGNVLARGENERLAAEAGRFQSLLNLFVDKQGYTATALREAARKVHAGEAKPADVVAVVTGALERDWNDTQPSHGAGGGKEDRRGGGARRVVPPTTLSQSELDPEARKAAAIERIRAMHEAYLAQRDQLLAYTNGADQVVFRESDGGRLLASRDPGRPDGYRVTAFNRDGVPVGHTVYDTMEDAILSAGGFTDAKHNPPYGSHGNVVVGVHRPREFNQSLFDDLLEPDRRALAEQKLEPMSLVPRQYVSPRERALSADEAETRRLAYALKDGDPVAIDVAAAEMATRVEPDAVLIPIPSSSGDLSVNSALAEAISDRSGAEVLVALERPAPAESSTERRRAGQPGLTAADHAFKLALEVPAGRTVYFVDNVRTTGATIDAATAVVGRGAPLVFAEANEVLSPAMQPADVLDTGEVQPRLPGDVGAVREQNIATPEFEAPFSLTSPVAKGARGKQTTLFQPAWHGSPHIFDRFSLHAIGNGEGAQAYGWGLYFASKREVADGYRKRLAGGPKPSQLVYDGVPLYDNEIGLYWAKTDAEGLPSSENQDREIKRGINELNARAAYRAPGTAWVGKVRDELQRSIANMEAAHARSVALLGDEYGLEREREMLADNRAALKVLDLYGDKLRITEPEVGGRTYKVDIPEDEDFLDWGKPASQQSPKVKAALKALGVEWSPFKLKTIGQLRQWMNGPTAQALAREDIGIRETLSEGYRYVVEEDETALNRWQYQHQGLFNQGRVDPTGEQIYEEVGANVAREKQWQHAAPGVFPIQQEASKALAAHGVAGIRYLDGFSRSAGEGSSNFVVFDDNLVKILEYDQAARNPLVAVHQLSADNLKFADRMGGIAVPSVAVQPGGSGALQGYGDVTLIGTRAMADPAQNPVFDADSYSATFPPAEYGKAKTKAAQALVNRIRPFAEKFDDRAAIDTVWDNAVNQPDPEESVRSSRRSLAMMAFYLHEQGIDVEPTMRPARVEAPFVATPAFQRFLKENGGTKQLIGYDSEDVEYRTKLAAAIKAAANEYVATLEDADSALREDLAQTFVEAFIDEADGLPFFGRTIRLERSLQAIGRQDVDVAETRDRLEATLRGREAQFDAWLNDQILGLHPEPHLTVNRKKVPYTLPNIVEKMTSARKVNAVQGGMVFGEGKARAYAATRIHDLAEMRNRAGWQIKSEKEIDAAREHAKELLTAWRDAVVERYSERDWRGNVDVWHGLDASMRALAKWATRGAHTAGNLRSALLREGFVNVPADIVKRGVEAGTAFLEAPVPYFESKPQRALGLDEFAGAVIPTTADTETRAILERNGVRFREYDPTNPAARDEALNGLRAELAQSRDDILFQQRRGSIVFGPDQQVTINLLERADLSTFLHESGHFFLNVFSDAAYDLAQRDPATLTAEQRRLMADEKAVLAWLGATSADDLTEEQHEQFARGFEAYLMEGKAPSLELRSAFARFRAWLIGVYRTLTRLNVHLSDEVRGVFDRMLASEQAINEAAALGRVEPMFTTAESAGMSPARFDLYRGTIADASRSAREDLDRQLMAEVRREQEATYKAQRAEIEQQVAGEVHQQPVYRALAAMQRGTHPDGTLLVEGLESEPLKLSRALLVERYGEERLRRLPKPYIYSLEGGLDPETVAQMFGFSSGDEMLTAIEQAPSMNAAIGQETNRRMLQQHGSILLDGTLHEKAKAALANEDRELVIRAELRALAQLRRTVAPFEAAERKKGREAVTGERAERAYERRWFEAEAKLRVAVAKKAKQTEIDALQAEVQNLRQKARGGPSAIRAAIPPPGVVRGAARKRIAATRFRDIHPEPFWTAARRVSAAATEAASRQDFDEAIRQKQQEVISLGLYREAIRAKELADNDVAWVRAQNKPGARARIGKAGGTFLDQWDAVLDRFEFAPATKKALDRRASLRKWMAAQEGEGLPVDLPEELLEETRRVNWQDLTLEELQGVVEGLRQIAHLAHLKNRLLKHAQDRDLALLVTRLSESIRNEARGDAREVARDRRPSEERRRTIADFFAGHRKLASMLREMDGFKDGGPMWEAIMRPLNEAGAREAEMNHAATLKFAALVERAFPGRNKRTLYTKMYVPEVDKSLSRIERIAVALNWGNEGNRDRVRRAEKWSDNQVQAILDTLSARDLEFVQGVFDFLNSYWDEIAAKQRRVYGVAPTKVEAVPFRAANGEVRGGYYPLKYDDRLSAKAITGLDLDAVNLAKQAAYVQSTTKRNHTKERAARVTMPVRRDFGVMFSHVAMVIHDLTHHEALIDIGRVLGHPDVQQAILEKYGDLVYKQVRDTVRDVAFGDIPARTSFERVMQHVRTGATIVGLGWRLSVGMLQPLGLANSIVRIGPKWVGVGLARWLRSPRTFVETARMIEDKSPMMRGRARTLAREIADIRNSVGVDTGKLRGWIDDAVKAGTFDTITRQGIADSYFWLIQQMQRIADIPTWLGAYEKARAANESEERSIALADQAVLDSQGGGQNKDLAQFQRGGPMMRLWTNFYSYFNVVYNQATESKRRTHFRNPVEVGRLASDYFMLFIVPATLGYFIRQALKSPGQPTGGDDDDNAKRIAIDLLRENLSYLSGMMLGTRELSGALQGYYGYAGPAGARAFSAFGKLGQQATQGELDQAFWKSLNESAGILLHYPAGQITTTISGAVALIEGKTSNPGALIAGPPPRKP